MIGTIIENKTKIESMYAKSCEVTKCLRQIGQFHRKYLTCNSYHTNHQSQDRKALKKCVELAKQFRIVTLDKEFKRMIKTKTGEIIKTKLVFSCNLPLKVVTTQRVKGQNGKEYELKAQTPLPTKESLESIKQYKDKFDALALWWVPNEIIAEEIKDPDPILVGKIETNFYGQICFELHRWIDENYEAEYWSKEGYLSNPQDNNGR